MIGVINLFANLVLMTSVTFFIIGVFGRRSHMIEKMPLIEQYFLRVSLSLLAAGAFFNVLTHPIPHFTEVVLHVGMAMLFAWAAWFHWNYFVKKKD